jgi:hypothetical protein
VEEVDAVVVAVEEEVAAVEGNKVRILTFVALVAIEPQSCMHLKREVVFLLGRSSLA